MTLIIRPITHEELIAWLLQDPEPIPTIFNQEECQGIDLYTLILL